MHSDCGRDGELSVRWSSSAAHAAGEIQTEFLLYTKLSLKNYFH